MVRNGSLAHEFGWHDKYMFTNRAPQAEHMRLDGWTVCGLPGAAYTYIPRSAFPPQYLTNPVLSQARIFQRRVAATPQLRRE